jgi:hypothetical protein
MDTDTWKGERMIDKYTPGVVRQRFDDNGELVSQSFIANGEVDYIDGSDMPVYDCYFYHPFDMVQPEGKPID